MALETPMKSAPAFARLGGVVGCLGEGEARQHEKVPPPGDKVEDLLIQRLAELSKGYIIGALLAHDDGIVTGPAGIGAENAIVSQGAASASDCVRVTLMNAVGGQVLRPFRIVLYEESRAAFRTKISKCPSGLAVIDKIGRQQERGRLNVLQKRPRAFRRCPRPSGLMGLSDKAAARSRPDRHSAHPTFQLSPR